MSAVTGVMSMKNASIATYKRRRSYYGEDSLTSSKKSGSSKSGKKKSPKYSFKQISSLIVRAKNSVNASQAYQAARRKLGDLRRLSGNAAYDQEEVEIAIRHAEDILRVARKKRNHLADEERAERERKGREERDELMEKAEDALSEELSSEESIIDELPGGENPEDSGEDLPEETVTLSEEDIRSMTEELCDDAEQMLKKLEDEMAMEEQMEAMSEFISPSMSEEDVDGLRKKHRAKEMLEITKADMKYLKAMFDKYQRERSEATGSSGYSSNGSSNTSSCSGMHISVSVNSSSCESPPAEGGSIDVST